MQKCHHSPGHFGGGGVDLAEYTLAEYMVSQHMVLLYVFSLHAGLLAHSIKQGPETAR